jgi:radical SAM protein with 4Fe4S-binding SPASM domain
MDTNNPMRSGFPMWKHMGLEIQSLCNRNCEWCPRYYDTSGIRKNQQGISTIQQMPTKNVYEILDQVYQLGFRGPVHFHSLSEPLLDSRYLMIVMHAHDQGFTVQENTNGDVLLKNPLLRQELDGIVDVFNIGLYDCKSEAEETELMKFWVGTFKKSEVTFSRMALGNPRTRQNSLYYYQRYTDPEILQRPCFSPQYQLLIRYDGEVALCCEDDTCALSLGNVFNEKIEDIWWSQRHLEIAFDLRNPGNRKKYPLCKNCYVFFGWD